MSGMKFETLDELSNGLWLLGIIPQAELRGAKTIPQSGGYNTPYLATLLSLKLTLGGMPVIPSSYNSYNLITIMNLLFSISSANF